MVAFDKLETSHALYESNLNFALAHRINAELRLRNLNIPESEVRLLQEYLTQNLGALAERTANPSVSNVVTDRHRVEHHHNGYSNIPSPRLSHMSLFNDGWWARTRHSEIQALCGQRNKCPLAKAQKEHADRTLPRSGRWPSPSPRRTILKRAAGDAQHRTHLAVVEGRSSPARAFGAPFGRARGLV
jgi:hypothetical protein